MFVKYLKILVLFNFVTLCLAKANDNGIKINTDLTAGIIDEIASPTFASSLSNNNNDNNKNVAAADLLVQQQLSNDDKHICTREEEYIEQIQISSMQPVKIRTNSWCMEFPPRCSNYKTEMREIRKLQNVTKTRTIRFCCAGYEGNISINDTVCKPVCRGGCGRGFCFQPDECRCEAGYVGKHCTQRCDHDHWGLNCKNQCQCHNGAVCDNKSGICHCTNGWTGEFCEQTCPIGTHGVMCRKVCECSNKLCHPQTGICHSDIEQSVPPNATHAMIATLNSTIVNITHNLDRIAKNIVSIATTTPADGLALPNELMDLTTTKPVSEVFVIKQDDVPHTPKIIVHPSGSGLLENLHNAAKTPEVIHVITNWPAGSTQHNQTSLEDNINLAGFAGHLPTRETTSTKSDQHNEHETSLLTIILVILLIVMVAIGIGFLYVYRRYHVQKATVEAALAARNVSLVPGSNQPVIVTPPPIPPHTIDFNAGLDGGFGGGTLGKSLLKPLPDLPAFTEMVRNKIEGMTRLV